VFRSLKYNPHPPGPGLSAPQQHRRDRLSHQQLPTRAFTHPKLPQRREAAPATSATCSGGDSGGADTPAVTHGQQGRRPCRGLQRFPKALGEHLASRPGETAARRRRAAAEGSATRWALVEHPRASTPRFRGGGAKGRGLPPAQTLQHARAFYVTAQPRVHEGEGSDQTRDNHAEATRHAASHAQPALLPSIAPRLRAHGRTLGTGRGGERENRDGELYSVVFIAGRGGEKIKIKSNPSPWRVVSHRVQSVTCQTFSVQIQWTEGEDVCGSSKSMLLTKAALCEGEEADGSFRRRIYLGGSPPPKEETSVQ